MSTLNYSISGTFRTDGHLYSIQGTPAELTLGSKMVFDRITCTFAAPVTLALGLVTTPTLGYFYNADDTNFLQVRDDAAVLAVIQAGRSSFINLESGVTLKVQADTGDCLMDYALWEEA